MVLLRGCQILHTAVFVYALFAAVGICWSADYPNKPIRLLVGFPAGGAADITARAIGQKLTHAFGQQVVVDNRAGAQGNIAAHIAAQAVPDGYTIYMGTVGNMAINVTLYGNLPYDPVKDFAPITVAVSSTNVLVVNPSLQAASVRDLIALAKARPGVLNYGSSGSGGAGHLAGELFKMMSGTEIVHVPYKGGVLAMLDLISGQVQINFSTLATSNPQMKAGKIRGLAVTTATRATLVPDLPTIAEAGLPGYEANNWYGLVAPAATPGAILDRLHAEVKKALESADLRNALVAQGLEPTPTSRAAFGAYIRSEIGKWAKVVKVSGARVN